ncbi:MAG: hypothetical protein Q4G64_00825 [bacterium]|nr:hypothetical protein [bacterium]
MSANYPPNPPFGQQPGQPGPAGGPQQGPDAPSAHSAPAPQGAPSWGTPAHQQGPSAHSAPAPQQGGGWNQGPQQGGPYGSPHGDLQVSAPNPKDPANLARYLVVGAVAVFTLLALINWIIMLTGYSSGWGIVSGILQLAAMGALTFGLWKVFDIVDDLRGKKS